MAAKENKPILLSVGYAACHWCHVMAHESFENPAIAGVMNRLFINIKVDREERPDIDTIYQSAVALLGQQGGWPLTMFLTPGGDPFWGGTYFPPTPSMGRPGFPQVLERVSEIYNTDQATVEQNRQALTRRLKAMSEQDQSGALPPGHLEKMAGQLLTYMDKRDGGLQGAPKFPQPHLYEVLWRAALKTGDSNARAAVIKTLTHLCQGGIYDHIGGGFSRYSTDARWLAPHFEKMLYDNALLIQLLTQVWRETGDPLFHVRIEETFDWLVREMTAPDGGFFSSLDADSEGEEGKFYVWSRAEIDAALAENSAFFCETYDITSYGNWEGVNIPNRLNSLELLTDNEEERLKQDRGKLLEVRERRLRPSLDDKILADWNGMMIQAAVEAGMTFDRADWIKAAEKAFAFVLSEMLTAEGRLQHAWRAGRATPHAMIDDYAHMMRAAIALFEASGESHYLKHALRWAEIAHRHYWDQNQGGYFLTADDADDLIVRTRNAQDAAVPSGNATMAAALSQLCYLTGNVQCRDRAEATILAFSGDFERNFFHLAGLVNAYDLLANATQIILIGPPDHRDMDAFIRTAFRSAGPNRVIQALEDGEQLHKDHPAFGKTAIDGRITAHVCRNQTCSQPVTSPEELEILLREYKA